MDTYDVIIAGGGPGGLAAAKVVAEAGLRVVVLEQSVEIGSPTRTTGGSFIADLKQLGVPESLYHPIVRCRFISPSNSVAFTYDEPVACVLDVRGLFQYMAEGATDAGAQIRLGTTAVEPLLKDGSTVGVTTKSHIYGDAPLYSSILIDATGYRSSMLKQAGVHPGFRRFGVGSEFDLYAPHYDQDEVALIVGSQVAPAGYAWAFPWGKQRVRLGVGIIHPDRDQHPDAYLERLLNDGEKYGLDLRNAQPIEYHYGLIPAEGLIDQFVGDGIMGVGDAAGQASALVGEGIRWAIKAGRMAAGVAVEAIKAKDVSRAALRSYQRQWRSEYAANLRIAYEINKKIASWDDSKWDRKTELLKLLSPHQFGQALQSNFIAGWTSRLFGLGFLTTARRRASRSSPAGP
jgi:digeranylgeranylglycerophospholipid reductase